MIAQAIQDKPLTAARRQTVIKIRNRMKRKVKCTREPLDCIFDPLIKRAKELLRDKKQDDSSKHTK